MCLFARNPHFGNPDIACNATEPGSAGWGLSDNVCQAHFQYVKDNLAGGGNFAGAMDYLEDYARIRCLLEDEPRVLGLLKDLAREIASVKQIKDFINDALWADELEDRFNTAEEQDLTPVRLSRALAYYEGYCWFPDSHANFAGLLTREGFDWSLSQGLMAKDPGAGPAHGDFSHRLQWHAIMRFVTDQFTVPVRAGWNRTPLDLFTSLGRAPAVGVNVWFFLFDNNSNRKSRLDNRISGRFSNPDEVHAEVLGNQDLRGLRAISVNREAKRRLGPQQCEQFLQAFLNRPENAWLKAIYRGSLLGLIRYCQGSTICNCLYYWKKLGHPEPHDEGWLNCEAMFKRTNLNRDASMAALPPPQRQQLGDFFAYISERVAYEIWRDKVEIKGLTRGPKSAGNRGPSAKPTMAEPIGLVNGTPVVMKGIMVDAGASEIPINQRVASSQGGFNTAVFTKTPYGMIKTPK